MREVVFLVVIYGSKPSECSTLVSLSRQRFSEYGIRPVFAVWDNSPHGYGIASLSFLPGRVSYYSFGINERLSVVYNSVVSDLKHADWFVFLDDDSVISAKYLESLPAFFDSGVSLAVPKIVHDGVCISPGMVTSIKGKLMPDIIDFSGIKKSKSIVAMMSGTVVRGKVFELGLRFDERLSFYGVDTRFFIDYSKFFSEVFILDVIMPHRSALRDRNLPLDEQVVRHKKLCAAWSVIFEESPFYREKLFIYIAYYAVKLSFTRRSLKFLAVFSSAFDLLRR